MCGSCKIMVCDGVVLIPMSDTNVKAIRYAIEYVISI